MAHPAHSGASAFIGSIDPNVFPAFSNLKLSSHAYNGMGKRYACYCGLYCGNCAVKAKVEPAAKVLRRDRGAIGHLYRITRSVKKTDRNDPIELTGYMRRGLNGEGEFAECFIPLPE
jgi:hypothetical protein